MALNKNQIDLMNKLEVPYDFANLSDDVFFSVSDKLEEELQLNGLNDTGDGLNEYGSLCKSVLEYMAQF